MNCLGTLGPFLQHPECSGERRVYVRSCVGCMRVGSWHTVTNHRREGCGIDSRVNSHWGKFMEDGELEWTNILKSLKLCGALGLDRQCVLEELFLGEAKDSQNLACFVTSERTFHCGFV
ncbi:uncharacterized protein [Physcomitrium patens]|uniref:Uncharacterized protein n=1 Tax=Physcomitrium patens TaxID=3218 RepID=A0A2K1KJ64_PHYPA|nr:hypothetical protein PHYPA_007492 [Physcomitrium patens]